MGNALFYGITRGQLQRLQRMRIQNSAARLVTRIDHRHHISRSFSSCIGCLWSSISTTSCFCRSTAPCTVWPQPIYIAELLQEHVPCRELRSASRSLLVVPPSRTTWGDRSFSRAAPQLWNSLPASVQQSPSLPAFKNHLKPTFTLLQTGDFYLFYFYFYFVQCHEHTME